MDTYLFIFAHNDDEVFAAPLLEEARDESAEVVVVYTTHGSLYGASSKVRDLESQKFYQAIGLIDKIEFINLGRSLKVFDGSSYKETSKLYEDLKKRLDARNLSKIIVPSWEGGHQDHDTCHLIGMALACEKGLRNSIYEFSLYNAYRVPGHLFRVNKLIPRGQEKPEYFKLRFKKALFYMKLIMIFKSQRKTFLALSPEIIFNYFAKRRAEYRLVPKVNYRKPPHEGGLFYEKRFSVSFQEFNSMNQSFITSLLSLD